MGFPIELSLRNGPPDNTSKPHILLVLDQFPKTLGGGERVVLRLAELLPQYGYHVSILTFAIDPLSAVLAFPPSCPVYLLPLRKTYDFAALKAAFILRRLLRNQGVRIVQTFFESSDLWAGPIVKMLSSSRLIWSRRDMGILRHRKHEIAYRMLSWLPDKVFAVSEQVRRHCIEIDGINPKKVRTIYNGLDLAPVPALSRAFDSASVVITTVGNIRRVKGHDVLIRAAALVTKRFPLATFTIAGEILEPEYFRELKQMIADLNLGSHVRFVGEVSNPHAHLEGADIFVLPSRSEGFSNAIIEAMGAGLPVIATDVGGNAEAVKPGCTGLIVPVEDATALAEAVCWLLDNPDQKQRMGAAGYERTVDLFTTEAMLKAVCKAYNDLLVD